MAASSRVALLLIDVQQAFSDESYWGTQRSTPNFKENVIALLAAFRATPGAHVLHVAHHSKSPSSPLHPSNPGVRFMPYAEPAPGEPVFVKTVNSALVGTELEAVLRDLRLQRLVVLGFTTAHCVTTTVRMASNLRVVNHSHGGPSDGEGAPGEIIMVQDATVAFNAHFAGKDYDAETVHAVHLASVKGEFSDVETTAQVIENLQTRASRNSS